MTSLVLAIEPDSRQAAIVKRVVREKVHADVIVVDSRDAALEALRTSMPDVLLLSALLSPRDEDELVAHLRTVQNAEHLQTHTIPQLSSLLDDDDKPSRGLFSGFTRRKGSSKRVISPAACDPDLFAEEVRTYIKHAADKKREIHEATAAGAFVPKPVVAAPAAKPQRGEAVETTEPVVESSWSSPFEWRPATSSRTAPAAESAPTPLVVKGRPAAAPAPPVVAAESIILPEPSVILPEPEILSESIVLQEPVLSESVVLAEPPFSDSVVLAESVPAEEPLFVVEPVAAEPVVLAMASEPVIEAPLAFEDATAESIVEPSPVSAPRGPLVMRIARGWWYEDGRSSTQGDPVSELRAVLTSLAVPLAVAAIHYAEGCRIRRVRVAAA